MNIDKEKIKKFITDRDFLLSQYASQNYALSVQGFQLLKI